MKRSTAAAVYVLAASFSVAWATTSVSGSSSQSRSGSGVIDDFAPITDTASEIPKPNPTSYPRSSLRGSSTRSPKVPLIVGSICGAVVLIAVVIFFIGRRPRRPHKYDSDLDDFVFQSVKPAPRNSHKRWSSPNTSANSVPLQVITSPVGTSRKPPVVVPSSSPAVGLTIYEEDHAEPPTSPLDTSKERLRHTIGAPRKSHKLLTISSLRRHTMVERANDDCDSLYNSFIGEDLFTTTLPNSGDNGIPTGTTTRLAPPPPPVALTPGSREARSLSNVSYEL